MRLILVVLLLLTAALILASFAIAEPLPANELGRIMILEYHRIDYPEERWTRTPENFRRDLEWLSVLPPDIVRGSIFFRHFAPVHRAEQRTAEFEVDRYLFRFWANELNGLRIGKLPEQASAQLLQVGRFFQKT